MCLIGLGQTVPMSFQYKKCISPNHEATKIPVEFLVLHYTAMGIEKTLECFQNPSSKVSSHLVIDREGQLFEVVPCLEGSCFKAYHAGHSSFTDENTTWKQLNDYSIGIELVNWNGNFFPYTEKQYQALYEILKLLKSLYPALNQPDRVMGHEHIAGTRGKIDPGHCFDWPLFFQMNYSPPFPERKPCLSDKAVKMFQKKSDLLLQKNDVSDEDWMKLSTEIEKHCTKC